jgi:tetratricopeptide (TPR) repeat protein
MKAVSLFLTASLLFPASLFAAEKSMDPNAAVRKSAVSDPLATLREVEKVQRTNNEISVKHFTAEIQKNAKNAVAYSRRGKAYSGLKDYDKAAADYEKAIELDPKLADAYVGRAVLRYVRKDYEGSWSDVHKAEELGGQFWPSFMEALKASSGRDK